MKYLVAAILILAWEAFPKGKLTEAAGHYSPKSKDKTVASAFKSVHDSEFVEELLDLDAPRNGVGNEAFQDFFQKGIEVEAVARGRKNRQLRMRLKGLVVSDGASEEFKLALTRNYWKMGVDSADFAADEDRLLSAHAKARNPTLRRMLVRKIASTRQSNIDFLYRVCDQGKDSLEKLQAVRKLGQLAMLAGQEGDPDLRDRIAKRLEKLHAEKRLDLSDLAGAKVMARTTEGRGYIKKELEKDGFRNWKAALWAIKEDLGYDYLKSVYHHSKSGPDFAASQDELLIVARSNLTDDKVPRDLKKKKDKFEFLEIRALAKNADSLAQADSLVVKLLSDKDEDVRFEAIKTTHFCLNGTQRLLSGMSARESSPQIKAFLHQYGYAEQE